MSIYRNGMRLFAVGALAAVLLNLSTSAQAMPVKVNWSEKRVTEALLSDGTAKVEFEVDQPVARLDAWLTASLSGVIELEQTVYENLEPGTTYMVSILLLPESLADVGHSVGGAIHMREASATRASPLPVSLKYKVEQEGQDGPEDEAGGEEDCSARVTWDIDELTSDLFTDGMATIHFTTDLALEDLEVWPTPSTAACLEIDPPEATAEENVYELKLTLVDENCKRGGTIHIRKFDGEKLRRTCPEVLLVRLLPVGDIGAEQPEEQEEAVPSIVVGAADFKSGPVAAGQIVSIFGAGLGPDLRAGLELGDDGNVNNYLADTMVLFEGLAAPLLSSSSEQINVIVPSALAGKSSVEMIVIYRGKKSAPFLVPLTGVAPALFTLNASGRGQGAILNEDLSVNLFSNPARPGSVIALYGTGAGPVQGAGEDGEIVGEELPELELPVTVFIDGMRAQVLYAGGAPGLVTGVLQVNVRLPFTGRSGTSVPVTLKVGEVSTDSRVTVAIQ